MTASVTSATASNMQGVDDSLNTSSDVSPHSPSPDVEIQSMMSVEDQSPDLSSDGKYEMNSSNETQVWQVCISNAFNSLFYFPSQQQSTVNDSVTQTVKETDGADSSEPADSSGFALQYCVLVFFFFFYVLP